MLVSLKWLKDYVDMELTADELAHRLTMAGLEVDEIKTIRPQFCGVVVAKILSVKPHPSADRLSLCDVSDGTQNISRCLRREKYCSGEHCSSGKSRRCYPGRIYDQIICFTR